MPLKERQWRGAEYAADRAVKEKTQAAREAVVNQLAVCYNFGVVDRDHLGIVKEKVR